MSRGWKRRHLPALLSALSALPRAAAAAPPDEDASDAVALGRTLQFPRDHGAHLRARTEWWYVTGWLQPERGGALLGFQVTFFRQSTGLGGGLDGRFVPRHLLFAHAAVSDVGARVHERAQRIARWSGRPDTPEAQASRAGMDVSIGRWRLRRDEGRIVAELADPASGLLLDLRMEAAGPPLLHGGNGSVRKGPRAQDGGHYATDPQLAVRGTLGRAGTRTSGAGRAWLDHEWSDEPLPAGAVGWDWVGLNFDDGSALMALQMRDAAGGSVWAYGTHRSAGGLDRPFGPEAVRLQPLRRWTSPATGAAYPLQWRIETPAGTWTVRALFEDQELDSRASTGAVYWEGLSEVLDAGGRRVGLGYLEMTGYVEPLRLG